MTRKSVEDGIFNFIKDEIVAFGFESNQKDLRFTRTDPGVLFVFEIHFYNETNTKTGAKGFLVEPFLWISVKEIEEYYKEITSNTLLRVDTDFKTLGDKIAELKANADGIHKKWNESLNLFVFEEPNINYIGWEILNHFKQMAIPYFLKNGSVKRVDNLLNKHPEKFCVHMSNDIFRYTKGIIAAKLNNNPKLNHLVDLYTRLIIKSEMPKFCREEMERLRSILPMIGTNMTF